VPFVERSFAGDSHLFIGAGLESFKIYCHSTSNKDLHINIAVYRNVTAVYIP
jgi:hypothetical protein